MEKASSWSLEVTVISAEDLRLNGRSVKKNAFVMVRTDSLNQGSTSIDSEGGNCPSWNQKLKPLPLPNSVHSITVEVQCKTSSGVKTVGTAMISVSEFIGNSTPPQYLHFLSYRLRDRKGERNGIINLSVKTVGSPATQNYFSLAAPPLWVSPLLTRITARTVVPVEVEQPLVFQCLMLTDTDMDMGRNVIHFSSAKGKKTYS